MLYETYQHQNDLMTPLRNAAGVIERLAREPSYFGWMEGPMRTMVAATELFSRFRLTHERPDFGIEHIAVGGQDFCVREETVQANAFAQLLHFRKVGAPAQPRVLLVAPWAGHFSTLLRDTVASLLADHDVYLTDWRNARDVPRAAGHFGLDDYIAQLVTYLEFLGQGSHVVAVCQPCPAVLSAVAAMAAAGHPAQPRSMTLMAGPIDTRINPTSVNELATSHPISWFERNLICPVPGRYPGANRRVYPGFLQVGAFMSMNLPRHMRAHLDLFNDISRGDEEQAQAVREFYDEYFSVLDLPAEFYLQTVERVFQDFLLARGRFYWRGELIEPAAIRQTALLTVEGERDDVCAIGQTMAAHQLCTSLSAGQKHHHLQAGVGHYGVFSGRRWQHEICPVVTDFIAGSC